MLGSSLCRGFLIVFCRQIYRDLGHTATGQQAGGHTGGHAGGKSTGTWAHSYWATGWGATLGDQDGPKPASGESRRVPRRPRTPKTCPRRAKMLPRRSQDGPGQPKRLHRRPRTAPRQPRTAQEAPKMVPDDPKTAPKRPRGWRVGAGIKIMRGWRVPQRTHKGVGTKITRTHKSVSCLYGLLLECQRATSSQKTMH